MVIWFLLQKMLFAAAEMLEIKMSFYNSDMSLVLEQNYCFSLE